jgi:succinate dehydrogenase / fumarate reductase, membrane anchor subunit
MGTGTGLGRVRGLGSAKSGSHHWWLQRVTALGNVVLVLWFVFSLARLPGYDYETMTNWLKNPLVVVPLALLIINVFWHMRLGLQVVIEDYVHGGMRIITIGLLHFWTFGAGALALYSLFKIAFSAGGAA